MKTRQAIPVLADSGSTTTTREVGAEYPGEKSGYSDVAISDRPTRAIRGIRITGGVS